jgi:para-aminobenzoate synthetase component 1
VAIPESRDLVPVLSQRLTFWVDPDRAAASVLGRGDRVVWLDSGGNLPEGSSVLGIGSRVVTASVARSSLVVDGAERRGSIFDFLREATAAAQLADAQPAGAGFRLGWVGWLGYGLRSDTLAMPVVNPSALPDAALILVDRAVVFDHAQHSIELLVAGDDWTPDRKHWRDSTVAALREVLESPAVASAPVDSAPQRTAVWHDSDERYLGMIDSCQAAIADGDAYQLCLTSEAFVDVRPDPLATYLALRAASPSHHGSFFRVDGVSVLSASPERFLAVSPDGRIESKPIKGTRPRSSDPARDAEFAAELLASEKERAENLMIVDLVRNDIARVSELGSVAVPTLLAVESYAQVHQLVSTVTGQLASGLSAIDAVEACFPAGSMTGAPKRSAVEILDRLEARSRGIYSGAFGYFGLDGRVDLAMIIRSIVLDSVGATVGAGGGITALSVPNEELAEVRLKAAVLLSVLGASDFR